MTPAQNTIIKADIISKLSVVYQGSTIGTYINAGNYQAIADYYNSASAVEIWKPDLSREDIINAIVSVDYLTLSDPRRDLFRLITSGEYIDATLTSVRNHFTNIFGTSSTLTTLTALAKRIATNLEALFTVSNVTSVYNETVSAQDIYIAYKS